MIATRNFRTLTLLALLAALALAGCGSDGSGGGYGGTGGGETGTGTTASAPAKTAFVSVGSVPGLGTVLVSSKGFTLYDFHKDKGTVSSCYGACAGIWPPLLTEGKPQPSNGAVAAKIGTTKRKDGGVQVTYAGHPLYTYSADTKPGQAKGQDIDSFGGEWYALTASGAEAEG